MRFSFESLVQDGALETHALDVALDTEGFEVEFVVFDFDLAYFFLELLILETILCGVTLDGDCRGVGLGFGLHRLGGRGWC